MINIEDYHSNLLKIDTKSHKNIVIFYIGYITIKNISDYENIYDVNPLYFIIIEVDGYIEEKNASKYLIFASTDKNKELLTKYTELWNEIKYLIKTMNGGEAGEYEREYMKIRFSSDDNFPLNKILKFRILTVIARSVFQQNDKYYPQNFR